jgi:Uma2 family endonuclease
VNADPARTLPEGNSPEVEAAFAAAPPEAVVEILDGELHTFPRPARPHTRAASRLGRRLGPFDDDDGDPGGWVILDEPELHLGPGPDKLVPDLAGWKRERMPDAIGPEDGPSHYDVAPDWICEVISPRTERTVPVGPQAAPHPALLTERTYRGKKMRIYRREGVAHAWLINPLAQTLEVYRLSDRQWTLVETYEGEAAVRAEPFDAIELPLAALWAR